MANIIEKIFHLEKRELNKYYRESEQVLAYDEAMSKLTDDELRHKTIEFKEKLKIFKANPLTSQKAFVITEIFKGNY